jgi:hypothetical protein
MDVAAFASWVGDLASIVGLGVSAWTLITVRRLKGDVRRRAAIADIPSLLEKCQLAMIEALTEKAPPSFELKENVVRMRTQMSTARAYFGAELAKGFDEVISRADLYARSPNAGTLDDLYMKVVVLHQLLTDERNASLWRMD